MKMNRGLKIVIIAFAIITTTAWMAQAERFTYTYTAGEKYRILSTVQQTVLINGRLSHTAELLNRIAVSVDKVKAGSGPGSHGESGHIVADFQASEEARHAGQLFQWGEEYHSEFWRDSLGYYDISPKYFMPVVRNVPVFPDRDLSKGDTWSAPGQETHDFRQSFGLPDPFNFTVPVSYTYLGKESVDGRSYDAIGIDYNVFYQVPEQYTGLYPTLITGFSHQTLYWDQPHGMPYSYHEKYLFIFTLSDGTSVQYSGTAESKVTLISTMDRAKVADDIRGTLKDLGVSNTEVKTDSRGVTISIQNIQFMPDSSELVDSEKQKLRHIGDILKKYPERDLLITGYTALAGTEEGRQKLSEERAAAVGQYLLSLGVRTRDHMIFRGMGARDPVAHNSTEAGRMKNRRVEITLMEN
ncbi:MAG TPA: OmpA family protein [Spirochaetia bacterium]|nr:OmpA family protein [Spirochaetia bacterium]